MTNGEPVLEIARRLELRKDSGYGWLVVIPSGEAGENSSSDVKAEIEVALGVPIRVITAGTAPIHDFTAAINTSVTDIVLLVGLDEWGDDKWAALDIQRSALERSGAIIFMLSPASVLKLSNHAPNVKSFIGGSIFQLAPGGGLLTESERVHRIKELESYFHLSSQEVLVRAEKKELSPDPAFVEWLVLLGRGDLV